ncbi:hypothetical protein DMENIID0001_131280 [Sergentomyia squamirostris]
MARGLSPRIKREIEFKPSAMPSTGSGSHSPSVSTSANNSVTMNGGATKMGSRRIFAPQFKLRVLESYRHDHDCKGNQRATARKYNIHRRQIQKWLQCESNLRSSVMQGSAGGARGGSATTAMIRDYAAEASVVPSLDIGRHGVVNLGYSINSNATPYTANAEPHHDSSSSSVSNSPVPRIAEGTSPAAMYSQHVIPYIVPTSTNFPSYHRDIRYDGPIDLSMSHRIRNEPSDARVPAVKCEWRQEDFQSRSPSMTASPPPVDLSCRTKTTSCSSVASSSSSTSSSPAPNAVITPPKVVKLFKPYLDSDGEDEASSAYDEDLKKSPTATNDPIIWSNHPCSSPLLYENNNIYAYDYNFYPSPPYHNMAATSATAPTYGEYMFNSWSPPVDGAYSSGSESGEWPTHHVGAAHSYSVDFKLKAMETYYHTDHCGIPAKFTASQRPVEKWLPQESDMRQ